MRDPDIEVREAGRYIAKRGGGSSVRYVTADGIRAHRIEITRPTGRTVGGVFTVVEGTGRYRGDRLRLTLTGDLRRDDGQYPGSATDTVDRSAAGIKASVRRLRRPEAEALAEVDREIARLQGLVAEQRRRRREIARVAWSRANVVRLAEVEELLP